METLTTTDYVIIAAYFAVTLVVGLLMTRRASSSMEAYFLGGRSLPWFLLGIAGMAGWFDLTGTMIITSFLYLLGPQGLFIEFRGGAVLVLAFMVAYTGKWHRRSGCMTSAEWVTYRCGHGRAAEWMRLLTALMAVLTTIGMLAYLVRGTSLFMGMFVPYPPMLVTAILIGICVIYTMLSGFYGVVLTDLVQGLIIVAACVIVSMMAFQAFPDAAAVSELAMRVTGNSRWAESFPGTRVTMPRGYEMYESLVMFAGFYLLRNILAGMGTGGESRYFGARSDRDCGLQSMLQGGMIALRWPMMIGFAILGLSLVDRLFPDAGEIEQASQVVHRHYPQVRPSYWHDVTSELANHPVRANAAAVRELEEVLGPAWRSKLPLVSFHGTVNPEQILPAVLLNSIPTGLRGLLLVAMMAAMMSTLTGTVNQTTALFVRDVYQNLLRPAAANRELIFSSYCATFALTAAGFWMGVNAGSINDLWGWIIMGLGAGALAPWLLRLYWWRCNAWGVVGGTVMGGVGAVVQRLTLPEMVEWKQFIIMSLLSFAGTIGGSLLTAPTERETLRHFYRTTRPFGVWGPLWAELPNDTRAIWAKEHRNDMLSVPFLMVTQVALFLLPMQLVLHAYDSFWMTLPVFLAGSAGVYWFWWRNLPSASNPGTERATDVVTPSVPDKTNLF